jgi:hypothetical protein
MGARKTRFMPEVTMTIKKLTRLIMMAVMAEVLVRVMMMVVVVVVMLDVALLVAWQVVNPFRKDKTRLMLEVRV